jgi:predicted MFS family arabinose efflux permease
VILHSIFGLVSPIVITTLCCIFRFIPVEKIKMPRRDYWFSPERRDETCTYLARQGLALGSLLIGLQALAWYQVVEANTAEVKQLPQTAFTFVLMAYGLVMVMWVLRLFRHFVQPPTESS